MDKNFKELQNSGAQIKQEIAYKVKVEPNSKVQVEQKPHSNVQNELHINVQIKEEPLSNIQIEQKLQNGTQIDQQQHSNVHIEQELQRNMQIKQELQKSMHIVQIESHSNMQIESHSNAHEQIKKEPVDQQMNMDLEDLYADHEIKEEMVVGPVVLQQTASNTTNDLHPDSPKSNKFYCDICNKRFSSKSNLYRHKSLHTSDRKFICDVCKKHFKMKNYLVNHLRSHADRQFFCDCGKSYYYKSGLNYHMQYSCTNKSTVKHTVLTRDIDPEENGQIHLLEPKQENLSKLEIANESSNKLSLTFEPKTCKCCKKQFAHVYLLKRHIQRTHTCHICKTTYMDTHGLKTHKLTHNKNGPKIYNCKICSKTYTSKYNLKRHTIMHDKIKPFACDFCEKRFYRNYLLTEHVKTHCTTPLCT